jgi:hypothetical protein
MLMVGQSEKREQMLDDNPKRTCSRIKTELKIIKMA